MTSLDVTHLSGSDAIVALRTYPRRFREAFAIGPDERDIDELARRIGPDGHAAIDELHATTSTLVLLGQALHQVTVQDDPVLHPAIGDPNARAWTLPPGFTVSEGLSELEHEITAIVDAAERVHGHDWNRSGQVAGGRTLKVIDIVRDAVLTGADNLHRVHTALAAARA